MAVLIPDVIDNKNKSDAEKKIFEWFKNDPTTSDWIVLHSLALDKHPTLLQGEIDFLVLAPNIGIFALEVKGGRVERSDGRWKFIDRNNNVNYKSRGPFEQASDGIFSIMNLIKNKYGEKTHLSNLLFGSGVMFPDITFTYESPEFNKAQVFDLRNGVNVGQYIKNLSHFFKNKFNTTYGFFSNDKLPTKKDVRELADYLRPNFEVYIPLLHKLTSSEEQINSLTNEQYNAIDQISDNKRILVLGNAGTGKTLIALQTLKKLVLEGTKKVAFFCFNSNLGEWLKRYSDDNFPVSNRFVGSLHSYLFKIVSDNDLIDKTMLMSENFYSETLPSLALDILDKNDEKFDYLIVDETQDLFDDKYLLIFDTLLSGGLKRGEWIFFADFNNQDIYSEKQLVEQKSIEYLEDITSFSKVRLRINCRNTIKITKEIENVTNTKYKVLTNQIDGIPVNHFTYSSEEEEIKKLNTLFSNLKKEKINSGDIIILSPKRLEDSVIRNFSDRVVLYSPSLKETKKIGFSTIHSFKGLERKIVIIVDVEKYSDTKLLYIGLSRARTALYIFETVEASEERADILVSRI